MVDYNKESDELNLNSEKSITKQFEPDEKILFSTKISKYNDRCKNQERNFLLTNKYIYNLKKAVIKRKIQTDKITALTVSRISNEFVIHIPEEYDYRYSHATKREKIVKFLDQVYRGLHGGEPLQIHYKDLVSLDKFTTKKDDKKKGIVRMPGEPAEANQNTQASEALSNSTIYSKDKGKEVSIEDFALLKQLGKGAFGRVMLVKKRDTGELFALKSIKKIDLLEKGTLQHTRTEQMVLEKLKHPFLVSLEYCFKSKEKIYFVMQFMKGGELFKYLRQEKRFSEERTKFYVAQVALGLGHLHLNHVIYRDMKPENVLMDEKGNVCLGDFGMAKVVKDGEDANSFCGTREYIAPEIITAEGHGKEADWWELGIFTYELLVGEPPFRNSNESKLFEMIQTSSVSFPDQIEISDAAKDFVKQCLQKNKKNRLGSQGDFEHVKSHPWLSDIDWKAMLEKKVEPPFKPLIHSETSSDYSTQETIHEKSINMSTSSGPANHENKYNDY